MKENITDKLKAQDTKVLKRIGICKMTEKEGVSEREQVYYLCVVRESKFTIYMCKVALSSNCIICEFL